MIRTYFKSNGKLLRLDIDTKSIGIAKVETQLCCTAHNIIPDSCILAVIDGGKQ